DSFILNFGRNRNLNENLRALLKGKIKGMLNNSADALQAPRYYLQNLPLTNQISRRMADRLDASSSIGRGESTASSGNRTASNFLVNSSNFFSS
ncbi:MAG: hypothetical protein IKL57_04840, partial [Oscillospiraceae bacterium]|nr:hypothetical protein [Oscillospiraceae bacterium]